MVTFSETQVHLIRNKTGLILQALKVFASIFVFLFCINILELSDSIKKNNYLSSAGYESFRLLLVIMMGKGSVSKS